MKIDQTRYHRLAGQVDPRRALRRLPLPRPANLGDLTVLDDERGVLDRRAVIARNEPGTLEDDGVHRDLGRARGARRQQARSNEQ